MIKKSLGTKYTSLNKRGFILIKTIIGILIISLVLIGLLENILIISQSNQNFLYRNNLNLDAEYGLNYIGKEVKNAILMKATDLDDHYKYKDNIGFYIIKSGSSKTYNIITYYLEKNELKRVAFESNRVVSLNDIDKRYLGINLIMGNVKTINKSYLNKESKYVELNIGVEDKGYIENFTKVIYLETKDI